MARVRTRLILHPIPSRAGLATASRSRRPRRPSCGTTWPPARRSGIYPWLHWHSRAHEALWVVREHISMRADGDAGALMELCAGDAMVLPAGTGHRSLGASPDLLVVGADPEAAAPRVAAVPNPARRPVSGAPRQEADYGAARPESSRSHGSGKEGASWLARRRLPEGDDDRQDLDRRGVLSGNSWAPGGSEHRNCHSFGPCVVGMTTSILPTEPATEEPRT